MENPKYTRLFRAAINKANNEADADKKARIDAIASKARDDRSKSESMQFASEESVIYHRLLAEGLVEEVH